MNAPRPIKQVLLMVDYGPGEPDSGDVYDLTAQVQALLGSPDDKFRLAGMSIKLAGHCSRRDVTPELSIEFSGHSYDGANHAHCNGASHLADVMNMLAPPDDRVLMLKAEANEAQAKANAAEAAVTAARMEQLAGMRLAHPVARLTTVGELMANAQPVLTNGTEVAA